MSIEAVETRKTRTVTWAYAVGEHTVDVTQETRSGVPWDTLFDGTPTDDGHRDATRALQQVVTNRLGPLARLRHYDAMEVAAQGIVARVEVGTGPVFHGVVLHLQGRPGMATPDRYAVLTWRDEEGFDYQAVRFEWHLEWALGELSRRLGVFETDIERLGTHQARAAMSEAASVRAQLMAASVRARLKREVRAAEQAGAQQALEAFEAAAKATIVRISA